MMSKSPVAIRTNTGFELLSSNIKKYLLIFSKNSLKNNSIDDKVFKIHKTTKFFSFRELVPFLKIYLSHEKIKNPNQFQKQTGYNSFSFILFLEEYIYFIDNYQKKNFSIKEFNQKIINKDNLDLSSLSDSNNLFKFNDFHSFSLFFDFRDKENIQFSSLSTIFSTLLFYFNFITLKTENLEEVSSIFIKNSISFLFKNKKPEDFTVDFIDDTTLILLSSVSQLTSSKISWILPSPDFLNKTIKENMPIKIDNKKNINTLYEIDLPNKFNKFTYKIFKNKLFKLKEQKISSFGISRLLKHLFSSNYSLFQGDHDTVSIIMDLILELIKINDIKPTKTLKKTYFRLMKNDFKLFYQKKMVYLMSYNKEDNLSFNFASTPVTKNILFLAIILNYKNKEKSLKRATYIFSSNEKCFFERQKKLTNFFLEFKSLVPNGRVFQKRFLKSQKDFLYEDLLVY